MQLSPGAVGLSRLNLERISSRCTHMAVVGWLLLLHRVAHNMAALRENKTTMVATAFL